jgi:hypothetical protein
MARFLAAPSRMYAHIGTVIAFQSVQLVSLKSTLRVPEPVAFVRVAQSCDSPVLRLSCALPLKRLNKCWIPWEETISGKYTIYVVNILVIQVSNDLCRRVSFVQGNSKFIQN